MKTEPMMCPYCWSVDTELYNKRLSFVRCVDCEAEGPGKETAEEAVREWNRVSEMLLSVRTED